jgi:putative Mg2+ transporter-C (MgtC) family protein
MNVDPQFQVLGEIAIAMALGAAIGLERELARKPAGVRTHMLVAGAAALFVGLGSATVATVEGVGPAGGFRSDPVRIIEAIVTGISFLGAGTIFRSRKGEEVEGLTTAATILVCAGIGIAVAVRQVLLAVSVTVLVLVVLRGLTVLEGWAARRRVG